MTIVLLTLSGWSIVAYVVITLPLTPTTQAIFYAASFAALAGSWASLVRLYRRRRGLREISTASVLASGMRFALVAEFGLWLQSLRMLTPAYAVLLVASYLLLEYLFRSLAGRAG